MLLLEQAIFCQCHQRSQRIVVQGEIFSVEAILVLIHTALVNRQLVNHAGYRIVENAFVANGKISAVRVNRAHEQQT